MVQSLCRQYSPPLVSLPDPSDSTGNSVQAYHPFPPPSVLGATDVSATLRSLGFGYRADFIQRTAKMLVDAHGTGIRGSDSVEVAEKWLSGLRDMETNDAREELLKFIGVGRKVADCVLLMSLDKVPIKIVYESHLGLTSNSRKRLFLLIPTFTKSQ